MECIRREMETKEPYCCVSHVRLGLSTGEGVPSNSLTPQWRERAVCRSVIGVVPSISMGSIHPRVPIGTALWVDAWASESERVTSMGGRILSYPHGRRSRSSSGPSPSRGLLPKEPARVRRTGGAHTSTQDRAHGMDGLTDAPPALCLRQGSCVCC